MTIRVKKLDEIEMNLSAQILEALHSSFTEQVLPSYENTLGKQEQAGTGPSRRHIQV